MWGRARPEEPRGLVKARHSVHNLNFRKLHEPATKHKTTHKRAHSMQKEKVREWGQGRKREFLASKHSPFDPIPADVHKLTWALVKLLVPGEAKPEHIPQKSDPFKGWAGEASLDKGVLEKKEERK